MGTEYISLLEISDELGVSVRALRYWAARNMLPGAVRFGRTWRVQRSAYQEWKLQKHNEQEREFKQWPRSISEREVLATTLVSASTDSYEGSRLAKQLAERLKKRQTSGKSV